MVRYLREFLDTSRTFAVFTGECIIKEDILNNVLDNAQS
jgi:hypothetical protein